MRVSTFTTVVLFAVICCSDSRQKQLAVSNSSERSPEVSSTPVARMSIKNTKGVVVLNRFEKGDSVRIYNGDGSLWYEFSYFYDDSDGRFDYAKDDFRPFAFHADHFLLALKCTRHDDNSLEVIVNEETGLRKYVKAGDPVLKLKVWDEFILSVFAVTFDQKTNPILEVPNDQMKKVIAPKTAMFRPVETRGNWLKVTWQSAEQQPAKTATGWIRWRDDETLLIDLSFFA